MLSNTRIPISTIVYDKASVYDLDTMYCHHAVNEKYATQFLKEEHMELVDFLNKGIFELVPQSRVP